jgi:hypothetical protein
MRARVLDLSEGGLTRQLPTDLTRSGFVECALPWQDRELITRLSTTTHTQHSTTHYAHPRCTGWKRIKCGFACIFETWGGVAALWCVVEESRKREKYWPLPLVAGEPVYHPVTASNQFHVGRKQKLGADRGPPAYGDNPAAAALHFTPNGPTLEMGSQWAGSILRISTSVAVSCKWQVAPGVVPNSRL